MWLTVRLWGGVAATILAAQFLGYRQPAPAWTTLVDCQQPCWLGIRPNVTTFAEQYRILERYGAVVGRGTTQYWLNSADTSPFVFSYYNYPTNSQPYVQYMWVKMLSTVRIGEVVALWGAPDNVVVNAGTGSCSTWMGLEYWQRKVVVEADVCSPRLSPDTLADMMLWGSCTAWDECLQHYRCVNILSRSPWYGFVEVSRYRKDGCVEISQ